MKTLKDFNVKSVLAIFITFACISAMVFGTISEMVLGALIGYVSAILQYYFGSSSGSNAKDKTIQDLQANQDVQSFAPEIGLPKPKEPRK